MSGASLIVCIALLIHGAAAKPYKPLGKLVNVAIQDTNVKDQGKVDWGLQVEPIEDLDPSMKFLESVVESGPNGKYQQAEEDLDELQHPSLMEVPGPGEAELHYQDLKEVEVLAGSDIGEQTAVRMHLEPEEDMDDLYHGEQQQVPASELEALPSTDQETEVRRNEPEEDMDDLYHGEQQQVPASELEVMPSTDQETEVRRNEPEEDMDDLYHGEQQQVPASELEVMPSTDQETEVRRNEPEEDMDDLYHQ